MDDLERLFNQHYSEIQAIVEKRRGSWRLSTISWEDVSAEIIAHVWNVFSQYDASRPLDRWVNTVASNVIRNKLRDNLWKNSKPCVAADSYGSPCVYNLGCGMCRFTKSGKQDNTCKFYARWEKKKKHRKELEEAISIHAPQTLDDSNSPDLEGILLGPQDEFLDIDNVKKLIDDKIGHRLTKEEAKIYTLLYVKNLEPEEVGKLMRFRRQKGTKVRGYMQLRNAKLKIHEVAKQILSEEGLIK